MRWPTSSVVVSLVVLALAPSHALADVTLELRPAAQFVVAGQQTGVEIYAVADPAEPVGSVKIVLLWDASSLTLIGSDGAGAHPWATASLPGGGLNTDWGDGNAYFTAKVSSACSAATASPTGLLITTLLFDATGSPGTSTVDISPSFDGFDTLVWDNLPLFGCGGVIITSLIGQSANVTIISCSDNGECEDANACTDDSCSAGVCAHLNNFDDTQDCCDPADGTLESLFDGNECTSGSCDPVTGQVTHLPLPCDDTLCPPCGDPINTTCTDPDTCDGAGNCVPNHAIEESFCEVDGDTCTRDRCASGDCVFVQLEDDGTPCDDGLACTPGQDDCQSGVCVGTGDPCIGQPGDFCLETEQVGPLCPEGDIDCSEFPDSTCGIDPDNPENPPRCRRPYTCGVCRPGFPEDCVIIPGNCLAPLCNEFGVCVALFLIDELCQDGLSCNGSEQCQGVGSPPSSGQCIPDETPPCPGQLCREETCCVDDICSKTFCECVDCIDDQDCDDFNPCNGLELCDQTTFTCVPGVAIDCSHLNDQCLVGVCNPVDGSCEAEPANVGLNCNDDQPCTILDTCTPAGLCEGIEDESPDGTVDLQWDANNLNHSLADQNVGETIRFDIWAVAGAAGVCHITGDGCTVDLDCPKLCEDLMTPCNIPLDCSGIGAGSCIDFQSCVPAEHQVTTIQMVVNFDPGVLQIIVGSGGHDDPCEPPPGCPPCTVCEDCLECPECPECEDCLDCTECPECTTETDCAAGVSCYCPGGPPCGDQPGEALGVCRIGKYCWGVSGFPTGGGGNDPDGLNVSSADGEVLFLAVARIGGVNPEPKAPVLGVEPLWVTTLEFQAIAGAVSTTVTFSSCTGNFGTRTRVIGDGAGNVITGELGQATILIRECTDAAECDDQIPCTDDSCDADFQCVHLPNDQSCDNSAFCDGVETCDPLSGCVSPGDPCVGQGLFCKEPPGTCVECVQDSDCNDSIVCTDDSCVNDVCLNLDTCLQDDEFCNGTEFCNLDTNACAHTGDPCPGDCKEQNEELHCPGCLPPLVESVGPRYIAITPQPEINPTPTAFLVTSSDWKCLSKYVGTFSRCGGTGGFCNVDADCNSCTLLNSPCLSDADCMTCAGTTNPCQSDAVCSGVCESVQVCQLSGQTCEPASFFPEIDINDDGLPDGILATLVDDPANRAILTAEEWGTTTYRRCSHSQEPCITEADCVIGVCSVSGRGCSLIAADCRDLCFIAQTECQVDSDCPTMDDACTGSQTCLPFETCQAGKIYVMSPDIVPTDEDVVSGTLFPTSYTVQAECGLLPDPVSVVMRLWADADDNGLVNFNDVAFTIKGFQSFYPPEVPSRTKVAFDIDGPACTPNQVVNIKDVLIVILAFKGGRFNPDYVGITTDCSLPCQ